jgi:hypothetical protein
MIIKWLLTAAIVYFVYRRFIQPRQQVDGAARQRQMPPQERDKNEDEYIDYEEVD